MAEYEPVVFEDSSGNIISNDPVWLARKTLEAAGVSAQETTPQKTEEPQSSDDDDNIDSNTGEDLDEAGNRTYSELKGGDLKALAAERGVDITGLTKVGEVREALRKADADQRAADEVNAANK